MTMDEPKLKIGEIFRATEEDITRLLNKMENDFGPNPFKETLKQRLIEEFVEKEWEIKKSPEEGFDTNIEYLFSQIAKLYPVSKDLAVNSTAYAKALSKAVTEIREQNYWKTEKPANDKPC